MLRSSMAWKRQRFPHWSRRAIASRIDLQTGQPRLTFGVPELLDGVNVVLVAVALFAVGEALFMAWRGERMDFSDGQWKPGLVVGTLFLRDTRHVRLDGQD